MPAQPSVWQNHPMSEAREQLRDLAGEWSGTKKLWMMPDAPPAECSSTAIVAPEACGKFMAVRYTWEGDGNQRAGVIMVRMAVSPADADLVWFDSWHQGKAFLVCPAVPDDESLIAVQGSYPAPPGPDWGWRIALCSQGPDDFRIVMHNITPDGQQDLAVLAIYTRAEKNENS